MVDLLRRRCTLPQQRGQRVRIGVELKERVGALSARDMDLAVLGAHQEGLAAQSDAVGGIRVADRGGIEDGPKRDDQRVGAELGGLPRKRDAAPPATERE